MKGLVVKMDVDIHYDYLQYSWQWTRSKMYRKLLGPLG